MKLNFFYVKVVYGTYLGNTIRTVIERRIHKNIFLTARQRDRKVHVQREC